MGSSSQSYAKNLLELGLETLQERRSLQLKAFAIKCYRSPRHRWWFEPTSPGPRPTRGKPPRFKVPLVSSARTEKRPLFILTKIFAMGSVVTEGIGLESGNGVAIAVGDDEDNIA